MPKRKIRKYNLEELLEREPIVLDQQNITSQILNQVVLITGAAGSIGSELAKQVCSYKPGKVYLIDQSETALNDLYQTLCKEFCDLEIYYFISSINDHCRMSAIFSRSKPQIVFHAAAYKHVPVMEIHPYEAIQTNFVGTQNLAELSIANQVEKFILISTDKAVNPSSIMGATKRLAEIYLQRIQQDYSPCTSFMITRFGNVLGSNGSFLVTFQRQIENEDAVTVTHPEVMRYFMTVSEACQLVLEACAMGSNGDVLLFDMGKPVLVADIAKQMIRMADLIPDVDIKIEYTGLRPGEKLCEELFKDKETLLPTHHAKILVSASPAISPLDNQTIKLRVSEVLKSGSREQMILFLKLAVPEYSFCQADSSNHLLSGSN